MLVEHSGLPRREAEYLLLALIDRDRAWYFAHADEPVSESDEVRFRAWVEDHKQGTPIAYLLGRREFWSLDLRVSPAVLIPRPDTELLVDWALTLANEHHCRSVLDLGTGSGAIALALATELPNCEITAVDDSARALEVACSNGKRLGLGNVSFHDSDWFSALGESQWPLIVSNPPYIRADDPHLRRGDLPAEPVSALVGGADGLECVRAIITGAPAHLMSGGWLLLEHGWDQGEEVRNLLDEAGFNGTVSRRDLAGHERVTGGQLL